MHEATAWLVELDRGLRAALGSSELVHVVHRPTLFEIPQTPRYCRHVMLWEGAMVPVLDLVTWLTGAPVERGELFAGVISYQDEPGGEPQRGAILASGIPARIRVTDEQACDLPTEPTGWRQVACSCFSHDDQAIPVLDLAFLFSGTDDPGDDLEVENLAENSSGSPVSHDNLVMHRLSTN